MTREEFYNFYNQNIDKVFRFLYLRTNSLESAQDLTIESFFKFWLSQENGQKIENPRAFLFKIARNTLIDFYRKKGPLTLSLDELKEKGLEISSENFLNEIEKDEEIQNVLKNLSKIKPIYQQVILLHYIENLSIKEISFILKKKENNVRVLLHRALEALKKTFS